MIASRDPVDIAPRRIPEKQVQRDVRQASSAADIALARQQIMGGGKPRRFRNQPCVVDGVKFDSKHEARVWAELRYLERGGAITDLKRQVLFKLFAYGCNLGKFTVDFTWMEDGQLIVADAKSEITRKETAYRLRKRIFEAQYRPLTVREL